MVLIRLLFVVKSIPLFIDFSLSEDAWLDVDLFLSLRVQIHFNCIISFPWIVSLFLLV